MEAETTKRETAGGWSKTLNLPYSCAASKISLQSSMDEIGFHCYEWCKWDVTFHSFLGVSCKVVWGFCFPPALLFQAYSGLSSGVSWCGRALLMQFLKHHLLSSLRWSKTAGRGQPCSVWPYPWRREAERWPFRISGCASTTGRVVVVVSAGNGNLGFSGNC